MIDRDVVDDGCNRDVSIPAEWKVSNGDTATMRCMLMNREMVVDVHIDGEVVVENHLDTGDDQVDVNGLDLKAQLLDLDVVHISDVLP